MSKARLKETGNLNGKRIWVVEFDRECFTIVLIFKKKKDAKVFKKFHDKTGFQCGVRVGNKPIKFSLGTGCQFNVCFERMG